MTSYTRLATLTLFTLAFCGLATAAPLPQAPCNATGASKPTAQERIIQRDIQEAIDRGVEEWQAKDLDAVSREFPPDFTVRLLDGTVLNRDQVLAGMRQDLDSILSIDPDRTFTRIECLTLNGKEADVFTWQQYVRTMPDRKNGSPHEVITSVRHRETWVYTKDGWRAKRVEELEQGPTFLDGEPYDPPR